MSDPTHELEQDVFDRRRWPVDTERLKTGDVFVQTASVPGRCQMLDVMKGRHHGHENTRCDTALPSDQNGELYESG